MAAVAANHGQSSARQDGCVLQCLRVGDSKHRIGEGKKRKEKKKEKRSGELDIETSGWAAEEERGRAVRESKNARGPLHPPKGHLTFLPFPSNPPSPPPCPPFSFLLFHHAHLQAQTRAPH